MFTGLYTGISGLRSQATKMEVIGNNLANVNTAGFKKDRVNFADLYYDVMREGSKGQGVIGGTNPEEVGQGVQISSIDTVYSQGSKVLTGRGMDFMIEGNDFFVAQSITNGELMLTRNGNFAIDGNGFIVDAFGNKVMGFGVDRESQVMNPQAGTIEVPFDNISPQATTKVNLFANMDASTPQAFATDESVAWNLFSTGSPWKQIHSAYLGGGDREVYGSGYYLDTQDFTMDGLTLGGTSPGFDKVTLAATSAFTSAFAAGDLIQIAGKTATGSTVVTTVTVDVNTPHDGKNIFFNGTIDNTALAFATSGTNAGVTVTNLTKATSNAGSSDGNHFNDVINSQVSMVDGNGNLLASYYLVNGPINDYTHATATTESNSAVTVGIGEFTNFIELSELFEQTLRDRELTNYASSDGLSVDIDPFGSMSFQGAGLVNTFRLVVNGENTNLVDYFNGIAIADNASSGALTQARVSLSSEGGKIKDTATAALAGPAARGGVTSTRRWFDVSEWNGYKIGSPPETAYGEFAGLRMDRGNNSNNYGYLNLSLTNGIGNNVSATFKLVANSPDLTRGEFTNMGELAQVIEAKLQTKEFSTLAKATPISTSSAKTVNIPDPTVQAQMINGRLQISTSRGIFKDLKLIPANQDPDSTIDIRRPDSVNFGTVLGELMTGVSGKIGNSNQFINPDAVSQTTVYDNKGNTHTVVNSFVKDRSASLTNIDWKYKSSLNPNLNSLAEEDPGNNNVYKNTFDSIQDTNSNFGTIGFDINTGKVLETGTSINDITYHSTSNLTFQPQTNSEDAAQMDITINFEDLTSFRGDNTLEGTNINGFGMGELTRLDTENNTGMIRGIYSNGMVRDLAQLGLMHITNPEGLMKIGSSYFGQTPNSSAEGEIKGVTKIYSVTAPKPASKDSVKSKIIGHSLEGSNVDLTEELTDMIITQRSYSASGKIITTSDELLQELLNLKR